MVIPYDFADRLRAGEPTAVQVLIDGSDSNTATIAQGYVLAIVNALRRRARGARDGRSGRRSRCRAASGTTPS